MFWRQWATYNIANTNNNTERFGVNGLHITIANTNNNTECFGVNGLHITIANTNNNTERKNNCQISHSSFPFSKSRFQYSIHFNVFSA